MDIKVVMCLRCGKLCRAISKAEAKLATGRPFRRSRKGFCEACVVCQFFQSDGDHGVGFALPPNFDPEGLRLPHIQKQLAWVLEVGGSQLKIDQINWDEVIANWRLYPAVIQ